MRPGPRGTAKDRALRLLGVRWRSRAELEARLLRAGFDPADVDAALADLEQAGLVDDARFAMEMARSQASGRMAGERAIRATLRQRGVAAAEIEGAVSGLGDDEDRAAALAEARAPRFAALPPEVGFRRLTALLVRRGYAPGVARDAARHALEVRDGAPDGDA